MNNQSKLRKEDEKCADIVSSFLEKYFYCKCKNYERINDKEKQIQGVDVIFELNNKKFICDEKAAIRYVNKTLNTFSLELSFIDKTGKQHSGWLLDDKKINNSFLFIWIDKATNDILTSIDDIEILDYALIYKKDIINYLNNLGWTKNKLIKKNILIRNNKKEYQGNLNEYDYKFSYSPQLIEKPINILIKRDVLKKLSFLTNKIKKYDEL